MCERCGVCVCGGGVLRAGLRNQRNGGTETAAGAPMQCAELLATGVSACVAVSVAGCDAGVVPHLGFQSSPLREGMVGTGGGGDRASRSAGGSEATGQGWGQGGRPLAGPGGWGDLPVDP